MEIRGAPCRRRRAETDGVAENARWRYTHFRMPDGKLDELVEERAS